MGAVEAFAVATRDDVGLFDAAGEAGPAHCHGFGGGGGLGGGGFAFGLGEGDLVEVGDALSVAPEDLRGDFLASGTQSERAQLPAGGQSFGGASVGVGGDTGVVLAGRVVGPGG